MAARTRKINHDDKTRLKIRDTQLVNLLQRDALGMTGNGLPLTEGRRKSAEILLRKRLPDLSSVDHTGQVTQNYVVHIPAPMRLDEWRQAFGKIEEKPVLELEPVKPGSDISSE